MGIGWINSFINNTDSIENTKILGEIENGYSKRSGYRDNSEYTFRGC